jgi:hypothetical protein
LAWDPLNQRMHQNCFFRTHKLSKPMGWTYAEGMPYMKVDCTRPWPAAPTESSKYYCPDVCRGEWVENLANTGVEETFGIIKGFHIL